jgi:hypothetical protein
VMFTSGVATPSFKVGTGMGGVLLGIVGIVGLGVAF